MNSSNGKYSRNGSSINNYTWDGRICIKCGGNSILPEYKSGGWFGEEHLLHKCGSCWYTWKAPIVIDKDKSRINDGHIKFIRADVADKKIRDATKAERKRCAKVCEDIGASIEGSSEGYEGTCAARILEV